MSSAGLDLEQTLSPSPDHRPAAADARNSAEFLRDYRAIKDARQEAGRIEGKAVADSSDTTRGTPPDLLTGLQASLPYWKTIRDLGLKLVAGPCKDLEVGSYVIEALLRTDGFGGLRQGFHCVREMVENSWDQLYPLPDEEGVATRVFNLALLNGLEKEGLLITPIFRVPITLGTSLGPYVAAQYLQAVEMEKKSPADREERIKRGAVTRDQIERAVAETDGGFFVQLVADLQGSIGEFDLLCAALDFKCGKDQSGHSLAPPSSSIRAALDKCLEIVKDVAKDKLAQSVPPPAAAAAGQVAGGNSKPAAPRGPGELETRDDAFRALVAVAEFFERTEPLSLLGAQIRKVVRLGRMSAAEYYSELIEDNAVRKQLFKMVGIKPESEKEKEK